MLLRLAKLSCQCIKGSVIKSELKVPYFIYSTISLLDNSKGLVMAKYERVAKKDYKIT
ncbi:hypothetical protein LP2241_50418 [Pseudolactococcus piscium]|nr:hypothetical protein LP2241_50418 [Lactococcus piscium]